MPFIPEGVGRGGHYGMRFFYIRTFFWCLVGRVLANHGVWNCVQDMAIGSSPVTRDLYLTQMVKTRLNDKRWTKETTLWTGPLGQRRRGRPNARWVDDIIRVAGTQWSRVAENREHWSSLEEAFTFHGEVNGINNSIKIIKWICLIMFLNLFYYLSNCYSFQIYNANLLN
uniref:SFRICE_010149 n=1 Tax=Spodoptera frugiperda TaxID=7108 RepID=A0A2H1VDA7_SPOFR